MRKSNLGRWLALGLGAAVLAGVPTASRLLIAADQAESKDTSSAIDWEKAKAIHQKQERGEALTDDEKAYLEKAMAAHAKGDAPAKAAGGIDGGGISQADIRKAREIKQKMDNGEKLSDDEKAFLEKVRAALSGKRGGDGAGDKAKTEKTAASDIDWDKARSLHQREQKGEKLTGEEQAYLDKAKAAMQRGEGPGRGGNNNPAKNAQGRGKDPGAPAPRESTGMVPLPQLGTEKYKNFDGGLYGGGKNEPPAAHAKAAQEAVSRIKPLDADGKPAAGGKVVLLSIGMSNTTQEFSRFKQIGDQDSEKSADVVIVDGAQGGKAADDWVDASMPTYQQADARLTSQHVTPKQVQVVWIKQAEKGPARLGEFPEHARTLQSDIEKILRAAKQHYPNLQIAYLSNRIYAGYAIGGLNPEPYAYESAFADRWVIEKQISGDASLNYDASKGEVKAPVVLWGPYLWSDGTKGRESDKLVYTREDLGPDGTHPSEKGRQKVAELLLAFLKTDATAKAWFVKH